MLKQKKTLCHAAKGVNLVIPGLKHSASLSFFACVAKWHGLFINRVNG